MAASSRNGPCPCGSGKKYKHCCLKADGAPLPAATARRDGSGPILQAAIALHRDGDLRSASAIYEGVLAADPGNADALSLLGAAEAQLRQYDRAIEHLRRAIMINDQVPAYYENLGSALRDMGDLAAAVGCFGEASGRWPDNTSLRSLLAEASFRAAAAYHDEGVALRDRGKLPEALDLFARAIELWPDSTGVRMNYVNVMQKLCVWKNLADQWSRVRSEALRARHGVVSPFQFLCIPSTAEEQLTCAQAWVARELDARAAASLPAWNRPGPRERLDIGYLSSDFRTHAVAHVIAEVFELHDRAAVGVHAYSTGPDDGSAQRKRIVSGVDEFVDLTNLTDDEAADRIRADGIDILLDLNGYTVMGRPGLLARRSAPIQVNYLGYPGTSGASYVDYIIADPFIVPPSQRAAYSERLAYLPHCYLPSDRSWPIAVDPPARSAHALPDDVVVFCAFNKCYKIAPDVFAVWMRILAGTPGSVLWLPDSNPTAAANLRMEAWRAGVDPGRLVFASRVGMPEHFARHRLADLFLDTLPYNGHSTTSDALWAGLPVLTCAGDTFVSRVAGSLLHAVGLPELVTTSLGEYEALALALAHDPVRLASLRARLRASRDVAPLFDSTGYARHLEALFRRMWEEYCRGSVDREPLSI